MATKPPIITGPGGDYRRPRRQIRFWPAALRLLAGLLIIAIFAVALSHALKGLS